MGAAAGNCGCPAPASASSEAPRYGGSKARSTQVSWAACGDRPGHPVSLGLLWWLGAGLVSLARINLHIGDTW
jgi:hypothetical protein